jgi:hypothetical protein
MTPPLAPEYTASSEDPVPEGLVGVEEGHQVIPAGAVHEDLDGTELVDDREDAVGHRIAVGHVHLYCDRGATGLLDHRDGVAGTVEVEIGDGYPAAFTGQALADLAADAAASTGDECNTCGHGFLLLFDQRAVTARATSPHLWMDSGSFRIPSSVRYITTRAARPW